MGTLLLALLLFFTSASGRSARGQCAGAPAGTAQTDSDIVASRVSGELTAVDLPARQMTLRTSAGSFIVVLLDDRTVYLRVPPGEVTLEKATPIQPDAIKVGDRVIARGRVAADKKSVPARHLIVMTQADLALKGRREREEWRRRGIAGRIIEIRPAARELVALVRAGAGEQKMVLGVSEKVVLRRFPPGTVKFSDTRPSSFEELKVGDHIRALGERSPDGARYVPEELISGAFRMVAGPVKAVDAAAGEVTIANLEDGQPITVTVTKDSLVRRVPPDLVAVIAQRKAQEEAAKRGGSAPPPHGGPGQPAGHADGDIQELIERLPRLPFSELKAGETLVVSSTAGPDPARVTGIIVAAGLGSLLKPTQGARGRLRSSSDGTSLGLPSGVLDGEAGAP